MADAGVPLEAPVQYISQTQQEIKEDQDDLHVASTIHEAVVEDIEKEVVRIAAT